MKTKDIRFYSPEENSDVKEKSAPKEVDVTGYISTGGKLVFPVKSVNALSLDPESTQFKIGTQSGKRKVKSLYLVPADSDDSETFTMVKAAKSYTIPLAIILQKGGIGFADAKYTFTIKPFDYQDGVTGYELQLNDSRPKAEYTGKPRGRKPKNG